MKLLYVKASGFKNCLDGVELNFLPKSKKTEVDKEYELQEIAPELFTFNTIAFVGKNASGKTSAVQLLEACYNILSNYTLLDLYDVFENVHLEMIFYHEGNVFFYSTDLVKSETLDNNISFKNQKLLKKKYFKSEARSVLNFESFKEDITPNDNDLPENISAIFSAVKSKEIRGISFDCSGLFENRYAYDFDFSLIDLFKISDETLIKIIKVFDSNIDSLEKLDNDNYKLVYLGEEKKCSSVELFSLLSSGTTKGLCLYSMMYGSLKNGFDLVVDEIENHFHKVLVDLMISLYKDKRVNTKNATLIFTTHYAEVMDSFNRQDNIWICKTKSNHKITFENMYESYKERSELKKSKRYYNNVFGTAVDYDSLMDIKKELVK